MIISIRTDKFSGFKVNGLLVALAELTVLSAGDIQSSCLTLSCCVQEEERDTSLQRTQWQSLSPALSSVSPSPGREHTASIGIGFHYPERTPLGNPSSIPLSGTTGGSGMGIKNNYQGALIERKSKPAFNPYTGRAPYTITKHFHVY